MDTPPIDNKQGQRYIRLFAAVNNSINPSIEELDNIVEIVKEDFLTPKEPIELPIVISNGNFTTTNFETKLK